MRVFPLATFGWIGAVAIAGACAGAHTASRGLKSSAGMDAGVVSTHDGGAADSGPDSAVDAGSVNAGAPRDAQIDASDPDGRRFIGANRMEGIVYTDLARSSLESRQSVALELLGRHRSSSRSVFGIGIKASHCIGGSCRYGSDWQPSLYGYGAYDLTVRPGLALYLSPSLYFGARHERRMAVSSQVGLSAHMHPFPSRLPGIGLRLYAEPRFPIGRSGRLDVLFGLGVFVSIGGPHQTMAVPPKGSKAAPSLADTLRSIIDKELSDIAIGDATVGDCPMLVGSAAGAPYEVPDSRVCFADLSRAVAPQTCALFATVSDGSLNARILSKPAGELLVEDVGASNWPVATYCNPGSSAIEIELHLWAPNAKSAQDVLSSRFDLALPWGPNGGESASVDTVDAGQRLALGSSKCSLVHIAHGGDSLTIEPGTAPKSSVSAPWYMELKITGEHVDLPKDDDSWLQWTKREPFDLQAGTARARPETGGPIIFCPTDAPDAGASAAPAADAATSSDADADAAQR